MSRDPSRLLYAPTHEWADIQAVADEQVAVVGISSFAIEQLNDLVYMDLPAVGDAVVAGDEFGEVESVKAVSPLYSPVTGEVIEVHTGLPDQLDRLKDDPYEFGWIMKVRVTGDGDVSLMDHAAYQKQCEQAG